MMDDLTTMLGAAALHGGFPPGVPGTPANRDQFARLQAQVAAAPPRVVVDIPWEYAESDDGDNGSGTTPVTPQGLLDAHAAAMDAIEKPAWAIPSPQAAATVWERGKAAWPGSPATTLTRDQWAAGRTRAFLALAAGGHVPGGYQRDHDMLPDSHPARPGPPA